MLKAAELPYRYFNIKSQKAKKNTELELVYFHFKK